MSRHILIVDDDEHVRDSLQRLLRSSGFQVTTANDGERALEMLMENDDHGIEIVITDVHMHNMNGIELARMMVRKEVAVPIVFMSGDLEPFTEEQHLRPFSDHFMLKPVSMDQIRKVLSDIIEGLIAGERRQTATD